MYVAIANPALASLCRIVQVSPVVALIAMFTIPKAII
jgi:hypothetical protein